MVKGIKERSITMTVEDNGRDFAGYCEILQD
jgi:hypothetical protein